MLFVLVEVALRSPLGDARSLGQSRRARKRVGRASARISYTHGMIAFCEARPQFYVQLGIAVAGFALASSAAAHHSFVAHFDMQTTTEIEGRVTEVRWVNPHIKIYVETPSGESWEVEAGPVNLLSRMGIERGYFKVGETIRALGNPGRAGAKALWVSNVLLADGTELLAGPNARPHWTATAVGDASGFFAAGDRALPEGSAPSLFRVWSPLLSAFPRPRGAPVLTAEGERAQAAYGPDRQVVTDCEVPGMPFAMMSPYPIELTDAGDRILIQGEAYDLERVAYLAPLSSAPAPTPLGYSRARIEGNELIIETDRIDYHSYGDLGPAQSRESRVVERFKLSADGLKLDYEIVVTDPVILAAPWTWGGSFVFREAAERKPWNCGTQ